MPDRRHAVWTLWVSLGLVTALVGQRPVLTVGGANPGFATLPAAVAAAAPGSVLLVAPGNYTGFSTSKPLRIVLDFTSQTGAITAPPGAAHAIEITGIPAGSEFVVVGRGARVDAGGLGAVRVSNTSGRVVIGGLDVTLNNAKVGLDVQNAATVIIEDSVFSGQHGLMAQDAVVVATDTAFTSLVGFGVVATRATIEFTGGAFRGTAAPAIRLTDSTARLAGDGSTAIRVVGSPSGPVSAFEAVQTDVQWDQSQFNLQPQNGAPGFVQVGGQVFVEDVPVLMTSGGPPGSTMHARLTRVTPGAGFIALGSLALPHAVLAVPGIYLDEFEPLLLIAIGTVDSNGLSRQATWPNVPWLLGEVFGCQGIVLSSNATWVRSAPGIWASM